MVFLRRSTDLLVACGAPARSIDAVGDVGIDVRAGLHTGEVELRGEDIGGIAVHIADRVASQAGVGEVLVSRTVVDRSRGRSCYSLVADARTKRTQRRVAVLRCRALSGP